MRNIRGEQHEIGASPIALRVFPLYTVLEQLYQVIFQLFVFGNPAQRLLIESDRRPGALDSRDGLLDIARVSRAVLFDPCIDEGEQLLSFMFWQLLQLHNDYFLKSHGIPSAVNAPNLLQAYHRTKDLSFKDCMRPCLGSTLQFNTQV